MIVRTPHGRREVRDLFEGSDRIPPPSQWGGAISHAGRRVSVPEAFGLPAAMAAVRLISESVGQLELCVYQDADLDGDDPLAAEVTSGPQVDVLRRPGNCTPFSFKSFVAASMEGFGGAFILKVKAPGGRVLQLLPMHPNRVHASVEKGELVFKVRDNASPATVTTLTRSDVIYIPNLLVDHPLIGVSPISAHRHALGTLLAQEEYEGRFYANDASPGGLISVDKSLTKQQREEIRESWESRHRTSGNAHRLAVLSGGATYDSIGVSMADAQFIESKRYGITTIAQIFNVPAAFIGGEEGLLGKQPDFENLRFLQYNLGPRLRKIEEELHADDDLFPDKALYPRFEVDGLLRTDFKTRAESDLRLRQAGIATANELRPKYGLGPRDDGDQLQFTPVGGAVNPQGDTPQMDSASETLAP